MDTNREKKQRYRPTCTDPIEVFNDSNFTVLVLHVVTNVVLFHVRADIFLHLLIVAYVELQSALQNT